MDPIQSLVHGCTFEVRTSSVVGRSVSEYQTGREKEAEGQMGREIVCQRGEGKGRPTQSWKKGKEEGRKERGKLPMIEKRIM